MNTATHASNASICSASSYVRDLADTKQQQKMERLKRRIIKRIIRKNGDVRRIRRYVQDLSNDIVKLMNTR